MVCTGSSSRYTLCSYLPGPTMASSMRSLSITHGDGREMELDTEWFDEGLPTCGDLSEGDCEKYGDFALSTRPGDATTLICASWLLPPSVLGLCARDKDSEEPFLPSIDSGKSMTSPSSGLLSSSLVCLAVFTDGTSGTLLKDVAVVATSSRVLEMSSNRGELRSVGVRALSGPFSIEIFTATLLLGLTSVLLLTQGILSSKSSLAGDSPTCKPSDFRDNGCHCSGGGGGGVFTLG